MAALAASTCLVIRPPVYVLVSWVRCCGSDHGGQHLVGVSERPLRAGGIGGRGQQTVRVGVVDTAPVGQGDAGQQPAGEGAGDGPTSSIGHRDRRRRVGQGDAVAARVEYRREPPGRVERVGRLRRGHQAQPGGGGGQVRPDAGRSGVLAVVAGGVHGGGAVLGPDRDRGLAGRWRDHLDVIGPRPSDAHRAGRGVAGRVPPGDVERHAEAGSCRSSHAMVNEPVPVFTRTADHLPAGGREQRVGAGAADLLVRQRRRVAGGTRGGERRRGRHGLGVVLEGDIVMVAKY